MIDASPTGIYTLTDETINVIIDGLNALENLCLYKGVNEGWTDKPWTAYAIDDSIAPALADQAIYLKHLFDVRNCLYDVVSDNLTLVTLDWGQE